MVHDDPSGTTRQTDAPMPAEEVARQRAIEQIERKRHFWSRTVIGTVALLVVTVIWAVSEYNNAGGWPTDGFSESSGTPHVWNLWIIYPAIAWVFLTTTGALTVYRRRPISEQDIEQEQRHHSH